MQQGPISPKDSEKTFSSVRVCCAVWRKFQKVFDFTRCVGENFKIDEEEEEKEEKEEEEKEEEEGGREGRGGGGVKII